MSVCKKIDQYTLDGQFIRTWPSARTASKVIGGSFSRIGHCAKGFSKVDRTTDSRYKNPQPYRNYNSAAGFVWRFHGEAFEQPYHTEPLTPGRKKIAVLLCKDGVKLPFDCFKEAEDYVAKLRGVRTANLKGSKLPYGYEVIRL